MKMPSLLVLSLACLTLAGCGGVDPDSPMGKRQALFKQMLKTSETLGGMLRGRLDFDAARFGEGAARLDQLSRQPWQHFPQAQEADQTGAKDEVWQRQARFQALARELEAATAALVAASTAAPPTPATMAAPFHAVEGACKACHQEFRSF